MDEIKEIVAALAAQYGADRIYLFGSYARGDADKTTTLRYLKCVWSYGDADKNSDIALSKMCMKLQ